MHQIMASGTLSDPKRHKTVLDSSKNTIFWYYIKFNFIFVLVPELSLESVKLRIMYVRTIAGQKLTEGYVVLC